MSLSEPLRLEPRDRNVAFERGKKSGEFKSLISAGKSLSEGLLGRGGGSLLSPLSCRSGFALAILSWLI
jgi:hypothetical protein